MPDVHDPAVWAEIIPHLDRALDLEPGERERWLAELAVDKPQVVALLRQLLVEREALDERGFLSGSVDGSAGGTIGPYRLIREIGRGGMSTVWLAEGVDGALQRHVALKLPHLAMINRRLAERMLRERDILAGLEHPNIARLYDAGIGTDGRPYLAIEYVEGQPLDVYGRTPDLSLTRRLDLFLDIARAVAFAHARLIVHRDLKPSNVLVKSDGSVRLLDFGIARLLTSGADTSGHATQFGGPAFTPRYAAPEQFMLQPISVATDIYSLGVLLYELLTGVSPYSPKRESAAALEDSVLIDEPQLPSRATQLVPSKALRGDLDSILLKALKKAPLERYASVEAFAADIERYLAGEPVVARPALRAYRAGKFLRRNALAVGASAAVVLALTVGLGAALWQWQVATRHHATALEMLANSEATLDFTRAVLLEGIRNDEKITMGELRTRAEEIALKASKSDARTRTVATDFVADWYFENEQYEKGEDLITRVLPQLPSQHFEGTPSLVCTRALAWGRSGREHEAIEALSAEIERLRRDPVALYACLQVREILARWAEDPAGALDYALQALKSFEDAGLQSPRDRASLLTDVAGAYAINNMPDRAQAYFERSFRLYEGMGRGDSIDAAVTLNNWANSVSTSGNPRRALELYRRSFELSRQRSLTGEANPRGALNMAIELRVLGRYDEALSYLDAELQTAHEGSDALLKGSALASKAQLILELGRPEEAQRWLDAANEEYRGMPATSPLMLTLKRTQSLIWLKEGRLHEAAALANEVLEGYATKNCCMGSRSSAYLMRSSIEAANRQPAQALEDARKALELSQRAQGALPVSDFTGQAWLALARLQRAAGNEAEAKRAYTSAFENLSGALGDQHPDTLQAKAGMEK